ncbi:MAG: glycoside hydrolase family 31 protein [Bacteroidales bacterium]|nr:glycoside hydrolase family 31 protein [Bacteroidales bacterium]
MANPDAIVVSGDMRFTVLTPEMIRIEWRSQSDMPFTDEATFSVINRELPVPDFHTYQQDGMLHIDTEKLRLQYRIGTEPKSKGVFDAADLNISMQVNGEMVLWHPGMADAQNLKGTCRTLDGANGDNKRSEFDDGVISRSGWAVIDEMATRHDGGRSLLFVPNAKTGMDWWAQRADPDGMDLYFMGYGHDYKQALGDFTKISGKIPMPPLYALGYWYSKYQKYTEEDFMQIVQDITDNDIPIDVLVIDMGWHKEYEPDGGWTGWSWDRDYFPDPEAFLNHLHSHDLKLTLNLHPADGVKPYEERYSVFLDTLKARGYDMGLDNVAEDGRIKWNLKDSTFYQAFFGSVLRPLEKEGVDFWWIDWQQEPFQIDGLSSTFWINHVFYNDHALAHPGERAMIFHRWGGLGNHRYQLGFSGDSFTNWPTLAFEPYFTSTASNVGYGYWGHDLGGHIQEGDNDPELYLRWIQFGVFTPIFRTHATNAEHIERRVWKYPNFEDMLPAFKLRYALAPYTYTMARKGYDTGISICRPLYYEWPEAEEAYQREGEYMFGDDILVNPIVKPSVRADGTVLQETWLPSGKWYDVNRGLLLEGDQLYVDTYGQREIPYFYRAGAIIPNYPEVKNLKHRPEEIILQFVPGADGEGVLYEDDGDSEAYKNDECLFTRITQRHDTEGAEYVIYASEGKGYQSQPSERRFTLKLLSSKEPKSMTLNGESYSEYSFDQSTATISILLPAFPTDQKLVIKVQ